MKTVTVTRANGGKKRIVVVNLALMRSFRITPGRPIDLPATTIRALREAREVRYFIDRSGTLTRTRPYRLYHVRAAISRKASGTPVFHERESKLSA